MGGGEWGEDEVPNYGGEEVTAVMLWASYPDCSHRSLPELLVSSLIRLLNMYYNTILGVSLSH